MRPRTVLYFHGFASSPRSRKVDLIAELLAPDIRLNTPDLNVPSFEALRFESMVLAGMEAGRRDPPAAIVGSSLGSLVALEIVRRGIAGPLILIAPALGVRAHWMSNIAPGDPVLVFNHVLNEKVPIHRAFFEEMMTVRADSAPPDVPVTIVMGAKDETIPISLVRGVWGEWERAGLRAGSSFIEIAEGDHSLVEWVDVIAREIRRAAVIP